MTLLRLAWWYPGKSILLNPAETWRNSEIINPCCTEPLSCDNLLYYRKWIRTDTNTWVSKRQSLLWKMDFFHITIMISPPAIPPSSSPPSLSYRSTLFLSLRKQTGSYGLIISYSKTKQKLPHWNWTEKENSPREGTRNRDPLIYLHIQKSHKNGELEDVINMERVFRV